MCGAILVLTFFPFSGFQTASRLLCSLASVLKKEEPTNVHHQRAGRTREQEPQGTGTQLPVADHRRPTSWKKFDKSVKAVEARNAGAREKAA
jgi:hypothetical protein